MKIKLPNTGAIIDLNREPVGAEYLNLAEESYCAMASGTRKEYQFLDKLGFIDCIAEQVNDHYGKSEEQILAEICRDEQAEGGVDDDQERVDYEDAGEVAAWWSDQYGLEETTYAFRRWNIKTS